MSRYSSTFIYIILALGLLFYLTFIDKKMPGTKEQEESETQLYKLSQDDVIKIYYGELTDLNFTISIADTETGLVKTYTNSPGNCGGIDNSADSEF